MATKITVDQTLITSPNHIRRFQPGVNSSSHRIADEFEIFSRQDTTVTERALFTNNTFNYTLFSSCNDLKPKSRCEPSLFTRVLKDKKWNAFLLIMTTAGWIVHLVPVWVWSV